MRLLGVEFIQFARFERQFISLTPGINLIVGRNNSGKTALLRGLTTLGSLPVTGVLALPVNLNGYIRKNRGRTDSFDIELIYKPDNSDELFIEDADKELQQRLIDNGILRFKFRVHSQGTVYFLSGTFMLTEGEIVNGFSSFNLVSINANGQAIKHFTKLNNWSSGMGKTMPSSSISTPEGNRPLFGTGSQIGAAFGSIKTRLLEAHRTALGNPTMQAASRLDRNGSNLTNVLYTLLGQERAKFLKIEDLLKDIFPALNSIDLVAENNTVAIFFNDKLSNSRIALQCAGAGIEQLLMLATLVMTEPFGAIILIDEPHTYLHPAAERALMRFLRGNAHHTYVMTTHSPVLINSVAREEITHLSETETTFIQRTALSTSHHILQDLGFRNSDLLFNDYLIIVEGKSDPAILLILLKNAEVEERILSTTGFARFEGVPSGRLTALYREIKKFELLVRSLGSGEHPRLYLLDSDRRSDWNEIEKWRGPEPFLNPLNISRLPQTEIENYLLVSDAIFSAIAEMLEGSDIQSTITKRDVESVLTEMGGTDSVKGSSVLEKVFQYFKLGEYVKAVHGPLIARFVNLANQPKLSELKDIFASLYRM
jgi:ABC-type transport system involved in cytochrome c biogenesis ATPase subunit